ncbi:MAG: hypothetical protein ACR2M3_03435 [Thermomicrobiales bacterium]
MVTFRVDQTTGGLTPTDQVVRSDNPDYIVFSEE